MNKKYEEISSTIQILFIYIFSGISMGLASIVKNQITMVISVLIYVGGLCTIQMLHLHCKKNELKIFGKLSLNIFGFTIWIISFAIITFPH